MNAPIVSVIVPNYNHARFLPRRVDGILAQTYRDFELVLLDDCSTDDSRDVLERYRDRPDVRLAFNEANSGSTFAQWNKGVGLARGRYVWLAESDDDADPRLLGRLVGELEADPAVAFAYCRSHRVSADGDRDGFADFYLRDLGGDRWAADFHADGPAECARYLSCRNTVPNASAVLFRKAAYEAVGGADATLRLCGDWKLWAALAMTGRVAYAGEPLNYYRFHPATVRKQSERSGLEVLEGLPVGRWIADRAPMTDEDRRRQRAMFADWWLPAVTDRTLSAGRRWAILQAARRLDPDAVDRLIRAQLSTRPRAIELLRKVTGRPRPIEGAP